jgi:3-oxoacyl-[acyl-carrier-protein] synthase-3
VARAGLVALADAGVAAEDVDVVLSWAMVPDRIAPANAPKVALLVGAKRAAAIGIEAACASGVAQLELATALVEAGRARTVLCTQSHLFARANPLTHPASPLFGDAATAFVVGASERPGVVATRIATHGEYYDGVTWLRGREDDPPWYRAGGPFIAGSRDKHVTLTLARRWVRLAVDTVSEVCAGARRDVASIDVLAAVQPRRWMPGAIAEGLGLPEERAPITFDSIAHVGGCGVVANLLEARRRGLLTEGKRVALYAVGAGVTRAAALIDWTLSR